MFSTLLIANRGEIARRIMRTARRMGLRCVSVYSDADVDAAHVGESDVAVRIGPAAAEASYLNIDAIMDAAAETGADAVHPGYGFLSENPAFAEACAKAGVAFVGPRPETIRAMGLKDEAKTIMEKAGVPVVPGVGGEDQSDRRLLKAAQDIGFPVMVKAVAGGGGKGMRRVDDPDAFALALASARREARGAFGDDRMIVEKLIENPRHIEVQVFGDSHGDHVHFFERDCSLQRRHQKVIEEAPAPGLTDETRAALYDAAIRAAKAVNYLNAGTVEFVLSPKDQTFHFIEMNTRLQVEHPVTEMVTGLDLVELQLKVASGEALPAQDDIRLGGHAIEARVYAEDPAAGFRPSVGAITRLDIDPPRRAASQARLRWDAGLEPGGVVSDHYDATIGKLIAWAATRDAALGGLQEALERTRIAPVRSNAGFLARCLADPDVRAGRVDTGLIGRAGERLLRPAPEDRWKRAALAGVARYARRRAASRSQAAQDPWSALDGWRLNAAPRVCERFDADGAPVTVELSFPEGARELFDAWTSVEADVAGARQAAQTRLIGLDRVALRIGDVEQEARIDLGAGADSIDLFFQGDCVLVRAARPEAAAAAFEAGDVVSAPMPGRVAEVRATPGEEVTDGEPLLVLEAMKMEHSLPAPRAGRVAEVRARAGAQVREGDVLVRLEPVDEEGAA